MTKPFAWKPSPEIIAQSNLKQVMDETGIPDYPSFWRWSVDQKEAFWLKTIEILSIPFEKKFSCVLDISEGPENPKWLKDARLNIVDACFQQDDQATAILYQSDKDGIRKISQKELENLVNRIANGLRSQGVMAGDYIAIDMPMNPESVAIYLAGIKAGNPVVTIADSFSPNEIAIRLKITQPKILFTQDYLHRAGKSLPLFEKVLQADPPKVVVLKSCDLPIQKRKEDCDFKDFLSENIHFQSLPQDPDDCINILFSSGTTGEPKAIPWTHCTPIKSASDGFYHHNIQNKDVICWPTNLGWMMGPWLVFASLINKATIALYHGSPMDSAFGKFIEEAKVTMLGVVPSIVRQWKNSRCMEAYDWSAIQCFSSTGEVSNPQEMEYLIALGKNKPVIEYCGGTEIGGGYVSSTMIQPNIPGTFSSQTLGGEFVLLDEHNEICKQGEVFLIPPILGLSNSLLNRNHFEVYYKDTPVYKGQLLRRHGDELEQLENGYYKAHGRVDDAMNLGGIKVSSIQIEAVINTLDFISESAAVAVSPPGGGPSDLVIYYIENENKMGPREKLQAINEVIKSELNPLFKVKDALALEFLPRTASGKLMRRSLRSIYEKEHNQTAQ